LEASAIPASVGLSRNRLAIGAPLLRIRSDEQLVGMFRGGNDDAFRVIHDRYRSRMFAYARQMLGATSQDPEDAVQEIFMRAYYGLRASDRQLALRAWLYRIAHNRCVDELRRAQPILVDSADPEESTGADPALKFEQRDALRRLIGDVQRLPDQQRSALLMRELSGMPYAEVAEALGVTVAAVKSLLVRARMSLAQTSQARNTACAEIQAELTAAHDRGVRSSGLARRHMRECDSCRRFRSEVKGHSRTLAALSPTLGPLGLIAHLLGVGGSTSGGAAAGGGAAGGAAASSGAAAAGSGTLASAGILTGGATATHVVTIIAAAAAVTAGGAVEIQNTLAPPSHHAHHALHAAPAPATARSSAGAAGQAAEMPPITPATTTPGTSAPGAPASNTTSNTAAGSTTASGAGSGNQPPAITEQFDPDHAQGAPTAGQGASPTSPTGGQPGSTTAAGTGSTSAGAAGTAAGSAGSGTGTASGTGSSTGTGSGTTGSTSSGSAPAKSTQTQGRMVSFMHARRSHRHRAVDGLA
jgi:RNA polymerase sigma factor (sigma-70 family)